jgi:hypothetical protein
MVGVSGSPDPKGEVGDLLKLGVETGVGKGDTYLDLRERPVIRGSRGSPNGCAWYLSRG